MCSAACRTAIIGRNELCDSLQQRGPAFRFQDAHSLWRHDGAGALQHFGDKTAAVLARRPKSGPLFPYLITALEKYRATEFKQRCQGLGIEGV